MSNDDLLDPTISNHNHNNGGGNGVLPNATATLVLGIISIVGCIFYGIVGLICGIIALSLHTKDKQLYKSNPDYYANSYKNANAGYICAIIGTSLSAIYFVVALIVIMGIISDRGF